MRLIDSDKLEYTNTGYIAKWKVDMQPTVDAVPVTRCQDCECFIADMAKAAEAKMPEQKDAWGCFDGFCSRYLKRFEPNDFCSYGAKMERKEK